MIKKEYQKPTMQVEKLNTNLQILAGSVTGVTSTGLDEGEELILPGEGQSTTNSVWDNAW